MQLNRLEPFRANDILVGWQVRFTDPSGQVRLAQVPLSALLDPAAFRDAVARQGIRYDPPAGEDREAWQTFIHELRKQQAAAPR